MRTNIGRLSICAVLMALSLFPLTVNAANLGARVTPDAAGSPTQTAVSPLRLGNDDAYIQVYGQINKGVLLYNDGVSTEDYWIVDNDNSSTRGGITGHFAPDAMWSLDATAEAQWSPYSTSYVNQTNKGDINFPGTLLRKAEIRIANSRLGKVWLGQGSMASDGTSEVDLSGTSVIGYASVSDMASGQLFHYSGGGLSPVNAGSVFSDLDGLGRKLRVRFETARYRGFGIGASVGTEVVSSSNNPTVGDAAFYYADSHGDFKLAGAAAISWPGNSRMRANGSFSLLHVPTGISVTVAGGYENRSGRSPNFQYLKLGYQTEILELGTTALSIDGYIGSDIDAPGTNSSAVGFQIVQNIEKMDTEIYAGLKSFKYEAPTANYDRGFGLLAGVRKKF